MAIFVLVHGAWHGAWCWRRVARVLSQAGHEVFTPGLTGIGERSHLLKPDLNLDTHILDVVNEPPGGSSLAVHQRNPTLPGGLRSRKIAVLRSDWRDNEQQLSGE